MSEKIQETQARLRDVGYFASEQLAKKVHLFEAEGKKNKGSIPSLYLKGISGAGKTYLAEVFAKMINAEEKFVQCFPRMGTENFQLDINAEGFIRQDADNLVKEGILLQAIEQSKKGPVVLTIDELDKARPEVDSFLLDFLENGRLSTGTDVYEKGKYPIYTIITSNDKREIDEALINRSRNVEVPRPSKELFLEILGLSEDEPVGCSLGYVYDKCPNFSIRQAKKYLGDLEELEVEYDEEALSQYINLEDLDVRSLEDIQHLAKMENGDLEIELPDLETCQINLTNINSEVIPIWYNLLQDSGEKFEFLSRESDYGEREDIYMNVRNIHQLELLKKYGLSEVDYRGYFAYEMSEEEMDSGDIHWASNKREKDGTRFGIKLVEDKMFKIAMNRGTTFVYLNSNENTLEHFLGQEKDEIEEEYETDSEYADYDREY